MAPETTVLPRHGLAYTNRLIREIEASTSGWRLAREYMYRLNIETYVAIRESQADRLAPSWWWEDEEHRRKTYLIDPLGERLPAVWADLMFGAEPVFESAQKGDQQHLDEWIEVNEFPSQLRWAEEICSSEGEVWWRHISVPALGHCMTEWHSRLNVIPLWVGRKIVAAAFVSILEKDDKGVETVYLEVHGEGVIVNKLYKASAGSKIADKQLPLTAHEATASLLPEWHHGLEMLCGRIPNKLGRDWRIGTSDYNGIAGLLLALNELTNIGQENARLTAKQRVVLPERFLDSLGRLPRGAEIIVATEVDQDPDKVKNDFAQITWEFDAQALIAYKEHIQNTVLTRARIAPQLAGMGSEGPATAPGWRSRFVDTLLALDGKASFWDDEIPKVLQRAMQVENLRGLRGGWNNTEKLPHFKRNDALPDDPESTSRRTVMEVNANVLSRQTAIEENNPNWGESRVKEELDRIRDEKDLMQKLAIGGNQGTPDPAGSIPRAPGQEDPSAVPDPRAGNAPNERAR